MMAPSEPDLVFGFCTSKNYETQTIMLVRSLREFGGEFSEIPIWALYPEVEPFEPIFKKMLNNLCVDLIPFPIEKSFSRFPFAMKTAAAAHAEQLAAQQGKLLAWHDRTGIILNPPAAFNLPEDKAIGFRPTDIANIGAPFGEPLPPFWSEVCKHCGLQKEQFPHIKTVIDQKDLYLYVNAGLLVVRPDREIFQTWEKFLFEMHDQPKFKDFYRENSAYAIFIHQAALTGAVIKKTAPSERLILPEDYLFSIDNFFDYPNDLRPTRLDDIVTGRFHEFFALENWEDLIIASEKLINWFKEQLTQGPYWPKAD